MEKKVVRIDFDKDKDSLPGRVRVVNDLLAGIKKEDRESVVIERKAVLRKPVVYDGIKSLSDTYWEASGLVVTMKEGK